MKNLKIIFATLLVILFINGCTTQKYDDTKKDEEVISTIKDDQIEHIGCQESEINKDGSCIPATENNASLFEKDTSLPVVTEDVNEKTLTGYIAKPKTDGNYPGVLMIHEWWGLNDNIKKMAEILADDGYIVFAIDLYDGQVAENSQNAGALATAVRENPATAVKKMKDAISYLKKEYNVTKLASLGWCFGGQQSLNISLNEPLDATVIYYGQLTDPEF